MLKKRLIGVVTVKNGWAVQSFGYHRYLPMGKPECLVENLDRWGADEILVQVIDRSVAKLGPDFELLERIGALGLKTPLIYAGGIRSISDGIRLIQSGADRIVIDALLHEDLISVRGLSEQLGAQALIASLPLAWESNGLQWLDYRFRKSAPLSNEILGSVRSGILSEVLIVDWQHEGMRSAFDQKLVEEFPLKDVPIIAFGGLSDQKQMKALLCSSRVAAVAVGNFFAYREHAVQKFKEVLTDMPLRIATYESKFSLLDNVRHAIL